MSIVCGTDLSEAAAGAARVAAGIARRRGEPLVLVHVAPSGVAPEVLDAVRDALDAQSADLGAGVREVLERGDVAEALASAAAGAGLLVVAGAGAGGSAGLGRIADRTAQVAHAPTLVVRDADRLVAWLDGRRPLRVLVAVDLAATSDAPLAWIGALRALGPCEVVVGSVVSPIELRGRLGAARVPSALELAPDVAEELARTLRERVAAHPEAGPADTRIEVGLGRVDDLVRRLAGKVGAELVVVGTRARSGLDRLWSGSVSRGVLASVGTSVALVPAPVGG